MENKKTKLKIFGKNNYYLGTGKDGLNYFLQEATWDCGWYWGGGYVETYTNNNHPTLSKDINSHGHFNSMFPSWCDFMSFFAQSPFTEEEKWKICELMKSFYIARNYSDFIHVGGAHITSNPAKEVIQDEGESDEYNRINKKVIPAIMAELYKVLEGEKED